MDPGPLLEPFNVLVHDEHFWNHTLDGLAVLAASNRSHVIILPRPVSERVVVADRFLTQPLRRLLQSVDRYQVRCMSLSTVRLFEGNRDSLGEVELVPEVPRTLTDALGAELTESHQTVASYGVGCPNVDGGLIGGASLSAVSFGAVARAVSASWTGNGAIA